MRREPTFVGAQTGGLRVDTMNKTLLCAIAWCALATATHAQQLPLLSNLQESAGALNPAAIATAYHVFEHDLSVVGVHHSQWQGLEGAPRTSQLSADVLFDDYGPFSPNIGVYVVNDQTGPTGFTAAYAKLGGVVSDDLYYRGVSFALQLGVSQYRLRFDELELRDEETVLAAGDDGRVSPDAGLGVYAYQRMGNTVAFAGLSVPQVFGLDLSFRGTDGDVVTQRYRHYYAQVGAIVDLAEESYFEAFAWGKYVPGLTPNVSVTTRYQTPSPFYVGVGGTSALSLHAETGVLLGDRGGSAALFRIGYAIDYAFADYGSYAGATHEVALHYTFNR